MGFMFFSDVLGDNKFKFIVWWWSGGRGSVHFSHFKHKDHAYIFTINEMFLHASTHLKTKSGFDNINFILFLTGLHKINVNKFLLVPWFNVLLNERNSRQFN